MDGARRLGQSLAAYRRELQIRDAAQLCPSHRPRFSMPGENALPTTTWANSGGLTLDFARVRFKFQL